MTWIHPLTVRESGESFGSWWARAKGDFADVRGTSFYRFMLPALADLYGVDFDRITEQQTRDLDLKIVENYPQIPMPVVLLGRLSRTARLDPRYRLFPRQRLRDALPDREGCGRQRGVPGQ